MHGALAETRRVDAGRMKRMKGKVTGGGTRVDASAGVENAGAKAVATRLLRGTAGLVTLGEWLEWTVAAFGRHEVALGQIATAAHDEALYLLLRTLDLPLGSKATVLRRRLDGEEIASVKTLLARRILGRVPTAYLTREAWLGGHRFYVDERVLIPRSYFLELIGEPLDAWLPGGGAGAVKRVADVGTGSGCLALLLAHHFPQAKVDAIDLSAEALEVAAINVREHGLGGRVTLHRSDVFDTVPVRRYDVIVSNPPYEPSEICDELPPEFKREPRLALDGGADGLDVIRKLLRQAADRLKPSGVLLIEVGELRGAMEAAWPELPLTWLATADGSDMVCAIRAAELRRAYSVQ